jgi:hypothetical protein
MKIKRVIFAGVKPNDRILKLALGLRFSGISTAGIFQARHNNEDYLQYFDSFIVESDAQVLFSLVKSTEGEIVHVFSLAADPLALAFLTLNTKKVVFDFKDIFPGIHPSIVSPEVEGAQKHILENAQGLVLRDGQAWLSSRLSGFRLAPKKILFPDFCWPEWQIRADFFKEVESKKFYRLVHIGMAQDEIVHPRRAGAGQARVFETLLNFGHEVHYFPGPMNSYKPYPALARLHEMYSGRFVLQPSLPDSQLLYKLAEYDFGLRLSQSYFFPNMPVYWHRSLNRYGVGARLYTYLSAGLPIVASPDDRAPRRACEMGLGILVNSLQQFDLQRLLEGNPAWILPSSKRRFSVLQLAINRRIERLIAFYESV